MATNQRGQRGVLSGLALMFGLVLDFLVLQTSDFFESPWHYEKAIFFKRNLGQIQDISFFKRREGLAKKSTCRTLAERGFGKGERFFGGFHRGTPKRIFFSKRPPAVKMKSTIKGELVTLTYQPHQKDCFQILSANVLTEDSKRSRT